MSNFEYTLDIERPEDYFEAENLTREAFWNVYAPGCVEHYLLKRFRTRPEFVPELSLCMRVGDKLVAHVMYLWSEIRCDDGRRLPVMTFGPISVAPEYQRRGIGTILLRESMEHARQMGAKALPIAGKIGFYGKSGFVVASTKGVHYYAEPRENEVPYFLIKELEPGFLDDVEGIYVDPEGYDVKTIDPDEFEAYDAQFPPKIKRKLPGQIFDKIF